MSSTGNFPGAYTTAGERIYYTATDEQGNLIPYRVDPDWQGMGMGMMMPGQLACATCHGKDGKGGWHYMHMRIMKAPDIRWETLSGEDAGHYDSHGDEHAGYGLEQFRQAVVEGQHPDGDPLSDNMPRWDLRDDELESLIEFLKSLK